MVSTTFWVLEYPAYHFILGREFLTHVRGRVDIGGHAVEFTTTAGTQRLATVPHSVTRDTAVYMAARNRLAAAAKEATNKLPQEPVIE